MPAAVFLDRDGTLIEDVGYIQHESQIVFFPETVKALQLLQKHFLLFIVTNQPGIAEGILTPTAVESIHYAILSYLGHLGIAIQKVYYCPHRRIDGCSCIKPHPHFLYEAERDFAIDLPRSFVIGDHPQDVFFARSVGATGVYVLTGHGEKHRDELPPDAIITQNIGEAALWILANIRQGTKPRNPSPA